MKPNRYEVRAENDCTVLGVDGRCATLTEARRLARKAVSSALSVAPRAGMNDTAPRGTVSRPGNRRTAGA